MGTFIVDGAAVLPPVKSDARPASGALTEWAAADANKERTALLDLRDAEIATANGLLAETAGRVAADAAIIASGATPADVGLAPVIATGSVQASAVADRFAREVWIEDFGEAGTGDWTTILNAAVTFLLGASGAGPGGTLRFKARTYRCDGKILFPNTNPGSGKPTQPYMKWVGAAAPGVTDAFVFSGTILDLRYTGDAVARIDTRGMGGWEATGITFGVLAGAGTTPIIQTTNTTLRIHHCGFYTYKTGQACDIDAIVCGGTDDTTGNAPNDAFQGYGTVIAENLFYGIRRGLYGRHYFNANVFRDNTFWTSCGTNLAGGAAVEIMASPTNGSVGNNIINNLFELMAYPYAIKLGDGTGAAVMFTTIIGNGMFDGNPGVTLGGIYCDTEAIYNFITVGHTDVHTSPAVTGPNVLRQTIMTTVQNEPSIFPGGIQTRDNPVELWATTTPQLKLRQEGTLASFKMVAGGAANNPYVAITTTPDSTGVEEGLAGFARHPGGAGYVDWNIPGSVRSRLSASGNMIIYGPLAGNLRLACGDGTTQVVEIENGKIAFFGNAPIAKQATPAGTDAQKIADLIKVLQDYGLVV